jgi:hypothetical protein
MKKTHIFSLMLVCLLALVSLVGISCTSFLVSGLEVAQQPSSGSTVGTFEINVNTTKFLGYSSGPTLFNVTSDATDPIIINAIKAEVTKQGGTKAINVNIEYRATFINILLNAITMGIYSPATAHVTGTVIK